MNEEAAWWTEQHNRRFQELTHDMNVSGLTNSIIFQLKTIFSKLNLIVYLKNNDVMFAYVVELCASSKYIFKTVFSTMDESIDAN